MWSGDISSDLRRPGVEKDSAPHQRRRAPRSLREVAVPVPLRPAPSVAPEPWSGPTSRQVGACDPGTLRLDATAHFRARAIACLSRCPENEHVPDDAVLPSWSSVPREGHFKVLRPHTADGQRYATSEEKRQQVKEYAKHTRWARACGVQELEFRGIVEGACRMAQHRRGHSNLPSWLCYAHGEFATQRAHAVLQCRLRGLDNAASEATLAVLGVQSRDAAAAEMHRLQRMSDIEAQTEVDAARQSLQDPSWPDLECVGRRTEGWWIPCLFEF